MADPRPSIHSRAAATPPAETAPSGEAGSASGGVGAPSAEPDPAVEAAVSPNGAAAPSGGYSGAGGAEDARLRAAERARRRRRLDRIFGTVLPEVTEDDRGSPATGNPTTGNPATGEDWHVQNRPPHHEAR
ncbi:hypothetical protein [Bounagaea algeriensis]